MKTNLLLLIIMVAVIAPFARAQDASPTPGEPLSLRGAEPSLRSDPSVSVPTESPAPDYPRPGTPAATTKPKSAPKKKAISSSPTPTPEVKHGAKPAKPQPASSPAAKKKELPTTVRELENEWAAATLKHDMAIIETLLASDYVGVTSAGNVVNKASLIAELKKDKSSYDSVTNSKLDVRPHGDATVVVGTTTQKGKDAAGKSFNYTYRWTDMWVKREGHWQCVASQSTRWRK